MIKYEENNSLFIKIIVSTISIIWLIVLILIGFINFNELISALKYLSFITFLILVLFQIINRWWWKKPPFSWLLKIPDFSGRWEGWYHRSGEKEWYPTFHEVRQKAFNIQLTACGFDTPKNPRNISKSICWTIISESDKGYPQLIWSYNTDLIMGEVKEGERHTGTHIMNLASDKIMFGKYFNNKTRRDGTIGGGGFIILKWVSKASRKPILQSNMDINKWGINKSEIDEFKKYFDKQI